MKNVLHVYKTYFPDAPGGVQEAIRAIALYTKDYGFQHSVFTLSSHPSPTEIEFEGSIIHREKQIAEPLSCPIGGVRSFQQMRRMAEEADLIVYHYPWPFGDLLSFSVHGKPSIVLYHSDIVKQKISSILYEPLRKVFLGRVNVIVATSPDYAQSSPVLQKVNQKLQIIPLTSIPDEGPEDVRILNKYDLVSKHYVLFIGVLRYYKGLDTLVKAAKNINTKIVIAGDGPEKEHLMRLKASLGAENVIFTGEISNAEKKALYMNASVFAFPSNARSEAFGISLAEAAMYGLPMVSCKIGTGTSFINKSGDTGVEVKPSNANLFGEAINTILNSSRLANEMGVSAKNRWKKWMSPEVFGRRWAELFVNLLDGKYK